MADQAIAATGGTGSGNATGGFALPPEMAAAAASSDPNEQMRAAAAAMKNNPEMLKSAARMMESMSPEQLEAMAASMPGGMPGMKVRGGTEKEWVVLRRVGRQKEGSGRERKEGFPVLLFCLVGPAACRGAAGSRGRGGTR